MDPAEYDYMYQLEDTLWWYAGMREIVEGLLRKHLRRTSGLDVLDAGCGTGGSLEQLSAYGDVTAFDFYPRAAQLSNGRQGGRVLTASIDAIPLADASFDLVTAFDVVCQLDAPSEAKALQELTRVMRPGGTLMVRVPALQALYGPHDVALQTSRRYSAGELSGKLSKAGLKPLYSTYANTFLLPVAVVRRLTAKLFGGRHESDVRPVAAPVNTALKSILSLEAGIIERTHLPIGLSVIQMARKP